MLTVFQDYYINAGSCTYNRAFKFVDCIVFESLCCARLDEDLKNALM